MRNTDRIDFVVAAAMIGFILIMVPFAAAFGTATYTSLNDRSRADLLSRHAQSAVLIDDPNKVIVGDGASRAPEIEDHATVQWTAPDGTARSTDVKTNVGTKRGDTVSVWVDPSGNVVEPPRSGLENGVIAVSAALAVWAIAAAVSFLIFCAVRWMDTRSRMHQWDREWKDVGRTPGWPVS
jgi:hypothetical protein